MLETHLYLLQHVENTIRFRESLKSTRLRSQSCVSMCTTDNKYRSVSLITRNNTLKTYLINVYHYKIFQLVIKLIMSLI